MKPAARKDLYSAWEKFLPKQDTMSREIYTTLKRKERKKTEKRYINESISIMATIAGPAQKSLASEYSL